MPQPFKQRETLNLNTLSVQFPDHVWVFWKSPTVGTLGALTAPFALNTTQHTDADENDALSAYYAAVSELVLDTGESGIDLSTPEAVRAAFDDPANDTELLAGIIGTYVVRIFDARESAKKKVMGG